MLRGLWKLTWLEIKIFLREPLGAIGTLLFPVLLFILLGKLGGGRLSVPDKRVPSFVGPDLPIFAAILISLGGVLSLATIVAIYREGQHLGNPDADTELLADDILILIGNLDQLKHAKQFLVSTRPNESEN